MTSNKASADIIAEVISRHGVGTVVCSPGSRNVPLLMAVDNREELKKLLVVDERAAAFAALGIASTKDVPVALVCTSGTAVLNYSPAVAEAFYRQVPLIVISADRPKEWIDQDDSQTLRQFDALRNFVKKSYDIPEDSGTSLYPTYVNRIVNDAMITALQHPRGPVHVNVQFDAPLHHATDSPCPCGRKIEALSAPAVPPREMVRDLAEELRGKKILLVAGFHGADARLNKAVGIFRNLPQVAVMAETISNLHLPAECYAIDSVLSTLSDEEKEALRPDVAITLGGALVSRFAKDFLRKFPPGEHWTLGRMPTTVDCFFSLARRMEFSPAPFLTALAGRLRRLDAPAPDYRAQWDEKRRRSRESHDKFMKGMPWCDFQALSMVTETMPLSYNLHLSNGTPIRYAQLLTRAIPHATFCNRGVSGIDGSTSTAAGGSLAYPGTTLLVTGDTSFAYDLSGLSQPWIDARFKVIVVNNGGGGIFHFIGTTRSLSLKEQYLMPRLRAEECQDLAKAFGYRFFRASSKEELTKTLPLFYNEKDSPALLEIVTDGELSGDILRAYMAR